ncbi:hypothetical protein BCR32DRAFT_307378 [Anaeromyces robustus]|uniref:Uncharacterized protein n=1 Tax=Anaeromyces robustus TaxID=1754192 RepID=A0A1Y1VR86_9FUNG|nr:hypothetical protein BCR32DRAFT_307378 [Anaeromyces robustus]|eukprot:ORX63693.1 hypothetical protein BCR32DRAFT_307378 [Anaeromyces robustus]
MEISLEKGQLLNKLKVDIENIIQEKTDFINKLNLVNDDEDPDEVNDIEDINNEQTIIDNVNYYNISNSLIKEFINYYYKSVDNNSFSFLSEVFENDDSGNNKFKDFNSKIFFECTQTFLLLQNFKKSNINLSPSTQSSIKKCNNTTMELLQFHIGNLSGKYMSILQDFSNTSLLYKSYGNVCDLLSSLCTISSNDFRLLNLSWKFLIKISCSDKLANNISKFFKIDEPINLCYENIKTFFDKVVEFIINNDIKKDQLKRNIVLIKFYFNHLHSLYTKHSNYITTYSIDESYPLFKTFLNLCLYIKYRLSLLFFKLETFNEEQSEALARLNDVVIPIDFIFSYFFSSKDLSDTQKLSYILYFIRFSYVDINVEKSYDKILTIDGFYYSKLLQLDVILRHFWQLSDTIQKSLLNASSYLDESEIDKIIDKETIINPSILYSYFNYISKCPSNLIRNEISSDDELNEITTPEKNIIITLSLLPHYIHSSLFNLWEKHYFSVLIRYENQIIQTILVESWCNIFKYLNNNIQINHIKQLYQLLILLNNTFVKNKIKTLLFKLIRINVLMNNDNNIIKELFSLSTTSTKDICSTDVENKLMILNILNMDDLYYKNDQTYKVSLEIWEKILCPLLEHPNEKIALLAFKKCSLPIKAIQKYLDNNGILSLSPEEIKKLQDVSIVLLGNCKTAIQADLKEPISEDEKMNAYLTFKTLESLIDISISLITEYNPENVIKILEIIDNWHFKVPYLKYELIPHASIINLLSACGQVDFTSKYINQASELLELLYHTYFNSSSWILKHQAFISITQFGVTTCHPEILKKIVSEPYQQQFINIVSGVPIFEKNKDVNIIKYTYIYYIKKCIKYLEQVQNENNANNENKSNNTINNSKLMLNDIFSLKLYVDNFNDSIKKKN